MSATPSIAIGSRARYTLAIGFGLAFAALAMAVLAFGYPHEDAYILFKYARHVGQGLGSVFFPGGPRAEGATDFLWMIALATGSRLGIDPAIGAAALNALGYGFAIHRLGGALERTGAPRPVVFGLVVFGGVLLMVHPWSAAGAVGFSATLYAALGLHLYLLLVEDAPKKVPVIALVMALVRPDGVLLGAAATLLALARARARNAEHRELGAVLWRAAACAAVGAVYFVLRWRYFGHVLPLPLIVKSHFDGLPPGIGEALEWIYASVLPVVGVLVFLRLVFGRAAAPPPRALVALAPFAIHVLGFVPSFPSQNIANRFQAPATLALFAFVLLVMARALAAHRSDAPLRRRWWVVPALFMTTPFQGVVGVGAIAEAFTPDYVNPFSVRLGVLSRTRERAGLPPLRIASTEAGRILYWTAGPVLDLVGLNSEETALAPPSADVLRLFDADVIMFHHASTLHEDGIERGRRDAVFRIDAPLGSFAHPWNRQFVSTALAPYAELHADNVRVAPLATAAYLDASGAAYELWAARFVARFARLHVYAIRTTLPEKESILRELTAAHEIGASPASHLAALRE